MTFDTLIAKANEGLGTDQIAGRNTANGFVGASLMTNATGEAITSENPFPAAAVQVLGGAGYSSSGVSVLDSFFVQTPVVTGSMTYSQAAGSLTVVSGTGANAEFLARSVQSFAGSMRLRSSHILSQRIANNNFALLLADLLGENLIYTIVNATTVDVTLTAHGFNATNVGQSIMLGGITGAAGIPGRYAIASIPDANKIRFTVAGWPTSGTGTLTLFGRNYVQNLFNGTTATNVAFDTQRNGWAAGNTTATINSTASPGLVLINELTGREAFLFDKLRASLTTPTVFSRASRDENIPDQNVRLHVFLWAYNGNTAPASGTAWTLGHTTVESFPNQSFYIQGARANGNVNPLPVAAQSSSAIIGDVCIQYRSSNSGAAVPTSIVSPATANTILIKNNPGRLLGGQLLNQAATVRWLKFFNAITVTPGTTSAAFEIPLLPNERFDFSGLDGGVGFSAGISLLVGSTRGLTNADVTGLAVGDVAGVTFHS
jgi:hypothetical protein